MIYLGKALLKEVAHNQENMHDEKHQLVIWRDCKFDPCTEQN